MASVRALAVSVKHRDFASMGRKLFFAGTAETQECVNTAGKKIVRIVVLLAYVSTAGRRIDARTVAHQEYVSMAKKVAIARTVAGLGCVSMTERRPSAKTVVGLVFASTGV